MKSYTVLAALLLSGGLARAAAPATDWAKEEFEKYTKAIFGTTPEVAFVLPGETDDFADDFAALKGTDGYAVRMRGEKLYFIADCPKGHVNGVHRWLEKNSDIIWPRPMNDLCFFTPSPDGRVASMRRPQPGLAAASSTPPYRDRGCTAPCKSNHPTIQPSNNYLDLPAFKLRFFGGGAADDETRRYLARNAVSPTASVAKLQKSDDMAAGAVATVGGAALAAAQRYGTVGGYCDVWGGGHDMETRWFPRREFFAAHPEYYMLYDGKRCETGRTNFCETNPDFAEAYAKSVEEKIRNLPPSVKIISVNMEDTRRTCQCENCLKPITLADGTVLTKDDPAFCSTRFFLFFNKVARHVAKIRPDLKILQFAYLHLAVPPKVKVERNVILKFCPYPRNMREGVIDGPSNAKWRARIDEWLANTPMMYWREYYFCGCIYYPRPMADTAAKDLRYIRSKGIEYVYTDSPGRYGDVSKINRQYDLDRPYSEFYDMNAMEAWVIQKLFWDPTLDPETLRAEFLRRTFGAAAPHVAEFYRLLRESWYADNLPSGFQDNPFRSAAHYIVERGLTEKCRAALAAALAACDSSARADLVRRMQKVLELWIVESRNYVMRELSVPCVANDTLPEATAPCWKEALELPRLLALRSKKKSVDPHRTSVRVFADEDDLVIRADIDKKGHPIVAEEKPVEGAFPSGDRVELMFAGAKGGYAHLAFDANGHRYTGSAKDKKNGDWQLQVSRTKRGWQAVARIPFRLLNVEPQVNPSLRFNVLVSYVEDDPKTGKQRNLNYALMKGRPHTPTSWTPIKIEIEAKSVPRDVIREAKRFRIGGTEFGFRIGLAETNGLPSEVTSEEMRSFVCTQEGAVRHLVWKGHPVCGDGFTVSADMKVAEDTVEYGGFRYEGNVSGRTVSSVVFPECRVPRSDETRLLRPYCTGVVFKPKWTVPPDDTVIFKDTRLSYGFIAALNGSGDSYYLDRRDEARFYAASYEFVNVGGKKELALRFRHDVPLSEATSRAYRLPYGGVFTRFRGDWYEAAMIYKKWVSTQPHYRNALARDRGRLRDVGLWMWSRGRSKDILPDVERVCRETGVPIALDWYWWHNNPYDTQYPFFWPPRENPDEFSAAVKGLHEKGVWVQPYTNGTAWDCDDPSWLEQDGRNGAVIRNGDIVAREWNKFAHHRLARMCGEAPRFQKIMEDLSDHIAESGFDSLYLDQINCLGFGTCDNPKHRHERGGGDHMIRNYRAFVDRIRAAHPGMQLSTEEFHEAYLDTFDSVISVYSGYERYGFKAPTAFVPVAPAIFHRCQTMYGSFATVGGLLPWDEFWPASERWPAEAELPWEKLYPDHFAIELCRGVTWGLQPMVHNFKAAYADDPRYADDCRFLFDTARFYHANRDLLFDGEMLNPGKMDCPARKVDFLKRKTFTPRGQQKTVTEPALPCVFHSVWRAPDGAVAAVLVNWSREDAVCRLATPDISFDGTVPARSWLRVGNGSDMTPWVSAAEREFVRRRTERIETQPGTPESDAIRFYSSTNRNEFVSFNYDESKAGVLGVDYTLEDPLSFFDGRKVESADDWRSRRKEILAFYERNVYGRFPSRPDAMVFELVSEKPTAGGLSIERRYRQWFRADKSGPVIDWLLVLPQAAKKPCPVILHLNYHGNDKVAAGRTNHFELPLGEIGARGYAFMSACYKEITSDGDGKDGRVYDGVCELFGPRDFARKDNPGSLIVWAWGLCRGLDLAEKIAELDARRNVVIGSSRLGKAALLAAAYDERFAVCVPNQTGAIGVQLMKRDYGETLEGQRLALPHWYCANVWQYADNPKAQPFDQHLLLSCVAPRALLLECYHKKWFDPKGEWLAAQAAAPVWRFLSGETLNDLQPAAYDEKSVNPPFGYVRRTGTHGLAPEDWKWALDFADKALD